MERYFSVAERRMQLQRLTVALDELIPVVASTPGYESRASEVEAALGQASALLADGFDQAALSDLARSVPSLFHPKWEPPLERSADGGWQEARWYRSLAAKLDPALEAAEALRTLGYRT